MNKKKKFHKNEIQVAKLQFFHDISIPMPCFAPQPFLYLNFIFNIHLQSKNKKREKKRNEKFHF